VAAYAEAEEPVSTLINDFGPPVASASAGRQRAAMPFVYLEREIWDRRVSSGPEIGPDARERGSWLAGRGAVGRLRPEIERLLADPGTLAAARRSLRRPGFAEEVAAPRRCCRLAGGLAAGERRTQEVRLLMSR
jgi:putative restriction endonuclease